MVKLQIKRKFYGKQSFIQMSKISGWFIPEIDHTLLKDQKILFSIS